MSGCSFGNIEFHTVYSMIGDFDVWAVSAAQRPVLKIVCESLNVIQGIRKRISVRLSEWSRFGGKQEKRTETGPAEKLFFIGGCMAVQNQNHRLTGRWNGRIYMKRFQSIALAGKKGLIWQHRTLQKG